MNGMSTTRWTGLSIALLAALACQGVAEAGGFSIPIVGGRMTARGGAFVATADDTTANFHNPAGLVDLEDEYRFDISVASIYSHTVYRLGSIVTDPATRQSRYEYSKPIYLEKPHGFLPFAGFSGKFGLERWAFGFAVYSPNNAATQLSETSPANYQLIEGAIITIHYNPNASFRVNDWMTVGAGFSFVTGSAEIKRLRNLGDVLPLPLVTELTLDAEGSGYSYNFGFKFKPTERLRIGLSYISEVKVPFEGSIKFDATRPYLPSPIPGTFGSADGKTTFRFPQQARIGFAFDASEQVNIGMDLLWNNYDTFKEIRISLANMKAQLGGQPITITRALPDVVEPKASEDIFTLAFGVTYKPRPQWEIHGGILYDESPYPNETYTILSPDADKVGFSLGSTYNFPVGLTLTGVYTRLFYNDRVVTQSILTPAANGNVIGKFTNIFSLQMGWKFGKKGA